MRRDYFVVALPPELEGLDDIGEDELGEAPGDIPPAPPMPEDVPDAPAVPLAPLVPDVLPDMPPDVLELGDVLEGDAGGALGDVLLEPLMPEVPLVPLVPLEESDGDVVDDEGEAAPGEVLLELPVPAAPPAAPAPAVPLVPEVESALGAFFTCLRAFLCLRFMAGFFSDVAVSEPAVVSVDDCASTCAFCSTCAALAGSVLMLTPLSWEPLVPEVPLMEASAAKPAMDIRASTKASEIFFIDISILFAMIVRKHRRRRMTMCYGLTM